MKTKEKKLKALRYAVLIIVGVLMFLYSDYRYNYVNSFTKPEFVTVNSTRETLLYLVSFYIVLMLHIFVHELGHLTFGLISGYSFTSISFLNLYIAKQDGKIKIRLHNPLKGAGGTCAMSPPPIEGKKHPFLLYYIGGCAANLLLGIIFATLHFALPRMRIWSVFFSDIAIIGIASVLINGIPHYAGKLYNDGYRALYHLKQTPENIERAWKVSKILNESSRNGYIADMPSEWFEFPPDETFEDNDCFSLGSLYCERLLEEKKFEEADAHYARLIESKNNAPKEVITHLICERLYIEIITRRRRDEIYKLYTSELAQTMQKMRNNPTVLRAEYAFAVLCERNPYRATAILEEFKKIERRDPTQNSLRSDKELISLVDTLAYEGYRTLFQ